MNKKVRVNSKGYSKLVEDASLAYVGKRWIVCTGRKVCICSGQSIYLRALKSLGAAQLVAQWARWKTLMVLVGIGEQGGR
jgi:hypothetical protein